MIIIRALLELLGVVFLRFRLLVRLWAIILVAVNGAAVFFLDTIYGEITLAAVVIGISIMTVIYAHCGYVRLLGIGHILWIPIILYFLCHLPSESEITALSYWLYALIVCNSISLVIDTCDVVRYVRGDRKPHYTW